MESGYGMNSKLSSVTASGTTVEYLYNGLGLRAKKSGTGNGTYRYTTRAHRHEGSTHSRHGF